MMALHRQYYVHALHEPVADPTLSVYGQSYLTIVERCNVSYKVEQLADTQMIVLMTAKVHALHPNVSARHWYIWVSYSPSAKLTTVPPLHRRRVRRHARHREPAQPPRAPLPRALRQRDQPLLLRRAGQHVDAHRAEPKMAAAAPATRGRTHAASRGPAGRRGPPTAGGGRD